MTSVSGPLAQKQTHYFGSKRGRLSSQFVTFLAEERRGGRAGRLDASDARPPAFSPEERQALNDPFYSNNLRYANTDGRSNEKEGDEDAHM